MNSAYRKKLIISALCATFNLPIQAATEGTVENSTNSNPAPAVVVPTETAPVTTQPATTQATPSITAPTIANAEAVITRPATEIATVIASKQHPLLTQADFSHRVADLDALYQASGYQPIWLTADANATERVNAVLKLLKDAPIHGLNSADYDVQSLEQKLSATKPPFDAKSKDIALYDTAMSLAVLRFSYHLHYGRINPRELHPNIQQRTEKTLDLANLIKDNQNSIEKLPELLEPKLPHYQKLKQALANYQVTSSGQPLKLTSKTNIRVGDAFSQSLELQKFLVSSNDLAADKIDNNATTYTDTMAEAVKKYQQRHNLKASGIINKATLNAFAQSASSSQKASQISLAMERLRWLPDINQGRAVMVNIPAFQLLAYNDIQQDKPTKTMRVVVGKAVKHQTPLLTADMLFVDFQPFWNVPFKIARDEILPHLLSNPGYLAGHNMEVVSRSGKRLGADGGSFASQIRQGSIGIRQRPGTGNALGKVKFLFPNKSDVYLHDTPSVALFSRSRRDLSHGCVRVSQPQQLAEFVLQPEGNWTTDSIKHAMNGKNRRVTLKDSIPVLFLYNTAFLNENHQIAFYADIYGHDERLSSELKKPRKDLADSELFAPKEAVPAEEPNNSKPPLEAHQDNPLTTAKTESPEVLAKAPPTVAPTIDNASINQEKESTVSP